MHTPADVEAQLTDLDADVYAVAPGDTFVAAGMTVRAHGGRHAVIHADIPRIVNVGFVIDTPDGPLYHPGDAFHVPDEEIATLFVPVSAPWLKLAEAIDFTRAVAPERAFALHDSLLVDAGQQMVTGHMTRLSGARYARLEPGEPGPPRAARPSGWRRAPPARRRRPGRGGCAAAWTAGVPASVSSRPRRSGRPRGPRTGS